MEAFEGLVVEDQAPAEWEGLEDEVLHRQGAFVGDIELAAPLLLADVDPLAGPQSGAGVLLLIRRRLDEDGSAAVPALSVKGRAAGNLRR